MVILKKAMSCRMYFGFCISRAGQNFTMNGFGKEVKRMMSLSQAWWYGIMVTISTIYIGWLLHELYDWARDREKELPRK